MHCADFLYEARKFRQLEVRGFGFFQQETLQRRPYRADDGVHAHIRLTS